MKGSLNVNNYRLHEYNQFSRGNGRRYYHHPRLHPMVKLITTMLYLVLVISFNPYNITGLMVFAFYPVILMALAEIPYKPLLKRLLVALPFSFFAGLSNIIFNQQLALMIGPMPVSYGVISFTSIMVKTIFTVMAVLILIATTSLPKISYQLLAIKVPKIIEEQIMLTYRYISVLLEQVSNMYTAYILRAPASKGIKNERHGHLCRAVVIKSFDRAESIYVAMNGATTAIIFMLNLVRSKRVIGCFCF